MRPALLRRLAFHTFSALSAAAVVLPLTLVERPAMVNPVLCSSYSVITSQLVTIDSLIQLHKVKYGVVPDFSKGWGDIVRPGWIQQEPICYLGSPSRRTSIALSRDEVRTAADAGWIYDVQSERMLAVCSADRARFLPIPAQFTNIVVVPNAPIRTPADLFRPMSRSRPIAILVLVGILVAVVTYPVERLARVVRHFTLHRQRYPVAVFSLVIGMGLATVWQNTWPVDLYGNPQIVRKYYHHMLAQPTVLLAPLLTCAALCALAPLAPLSFADRRWLANLHATKQRCPRCKYDTRGNATRCSECGKVLPAHLHRARLSTS